jgi:hypothetical protein
VNSDYLTIRKGGGIEARRILRVLVEPEANRVFRLHVRVLLVLDQGRRRGLATNAAALSESYRWRDRFRRDHANIAAEV